MEGKKFNRLSQKLNLQPKVLKDISLPIHILVAPGK